ncbi:molybdenum cofactor biosynthesis protein [Alicyclobacillus sp. ALC3]|uniref:molybdenum cofactor biosynthesis protein n=1 Tax=Alicyclobacillus sp. ALC3 TaxID=2796143 RepID=UPI0023794A62|nr:molybdenum cofactor biosynthesis protein MoaE [Alicyclobacillus sp. ALC3]WDL97070.1 molybdenum cofactor biosynthesis protein MoaE [Alicyclobacillus sp. ALC3]
MKLTIKLFAGLAERAGSSAITVDIQSETISVEALKAVVEERFPDNVDSVRRALVAINRRYVEDGQLISASDEVALIPPVSGGSPYPSCRITTEPLEPAEALLELADPAFGGTVLFSGTVREWTRGRQSLYLEYEAYLDMALAQMQKIEAEVQAEWPGVRTLQWHRIGQLFPTDIAVLCAAASPHRDAAFQAARTLIERLKKEVPIWKKEFYADGETTWQETP